MTQRGNLTRATAPATKPSQRLRDRQRAKTRPLAERRLSDFLPLGPAEQLLLDCCRVGEVAQVAEKRPEAPDATNRIRASFLRFLLLGGDEQAPVHERGVWLSGCWVDSQLDLDGCVVQCNAVLVNSHFKDLLLAQDARLSALLSLTGSCLSRGMNADRLQINGDVLLRAGFNAKHEVRLLGAQIGGSLECQGGQFEVKDGDALSADGAVVKGSVFLSEGFRATGEVRLLGAQIGGNLDCQGGQFGVKGGAALSADHAVVKGDVSLSEGFRATGKVRLLGAQIDGNLDCEGGQFEVKDGAALLADRAVVKGGLFLRGLKAAVRLGLSHAEVGVLADEVDAWAPGSVLDGFRYGALGGDAPTSGAERLAWLEKQSVEHLKADFRPQPWRQLQRVLHEMGHHEDAKQIGIAFQDRLRAIGRIGQSPPTTSRAAAWARRVFAEGAHFCFGKLALYGFRPTRLLAWMAGVWLVCGVLFWLLALPPFSALAPSDPLVFQNPAYEECMPPPEKLLPPGNWFLCGKLRSEYATFSPFAFSLDILLPLVDLGQEKYWGAFVPTPMPGVTEEILNWSSGHAARLLIWFETLFGWVCSLLLAAIVSGLARRSEEG